MSASPVVVKGSHVQRVEDYLQQQSLVVPTPEECRQHFTPDGVENALHNLRTIGFCVIPGWFDLPDDANAGVLVEMEDTRKPALIRATKYD